jgi:hypothetical protein
VGGRVGWRRVGGRSPGVVGVRGGGSAGFGGEVAVTGVVEVADRGSRGRCAGVAGEVAGGAVVVAGGDRSRAVGFDQPAEQVVGRPGGGISPRVLTRFGSTMRVIRVRDAGDARRVRAPVRARNLAMADNALRGERTTRVAAGPSRVGRAHADGVAGWGRVATGRVRGLAARGRARAGGCVRGARGVRVG